MNEDQKRHCFRVAEELGLIGNFMSGVAQKRLDQCYRCRDYRLALETLRETKERKVKRALTDEERQERSVYNFKELFINFLS